MQTMAKKDACWKVAHWALQLEEFEYTVEHWTGTAMRHADALSRYLVECLNVQDTRNILIAQLRQTQAEDPYLQRTIQLVKNDTCKDFILTNGVLYKENLGNHLLMMPKQMQQEMVIKSHERGHFSWCNTEYLMKQEY